MSDGRLEYDITADASGFNRTVQGMLSNTGRMTAAFAGFAALAGGAALARGFSFAKELQDSEKAIANVVAQFQGLNKAASAGVAKEAMEQIRLLEPQTSAGLQDMVQGFMASTAAAQSAGLSVKQNIDLVAKFANALANASIPAEQLAQEMRSILSGNINADSALARTLGITNEMVSKAQAAGTMYEFLSNKLGSLGEAGDTAGVAFSTLQSAIDKALAATAEPLLNVAVAKAKEFAKAIDDPRVQSDLREVGRAIAGIAQAATSAAPAISSLTSEVRHFATFAQASFEQGGKAVAWMAADAEKGDSSFKKLAKSAMLPLGPLMALGNVTRQVMGVSEAAGDRSLKSAIDYVARVNDAAAKNEEFKRSIQAASEAMKQVQKVDWEMITSQGKARQMQWLKEIAEAAAQAGVELEAAKDLQATGGDLAMVKRLDEKIRVYKDLLGVESSKDVLNNASGKKPEELRNATEMLRLEMQRAAILRQIVGHEREALIVRIAAAQAAQRQAAANAATRGSAIAELAILEALARGHDKKAEKIQRELRLQQLIAHYQQLGASPEEARKKAERHVNAEEDLARRQQGKGRKIRGYRQSDGAAQDFGGIDEWEAMQKGDGPLGNQKTPGLDQFYRQQDRSQPAFPGPGQPNAGQAAMERSSSAQRSAMGEQRARDQREKQMASNTGGSDAKLTQICAELETLNRKMEQLQAA